MGGSLAFPLRTLERMRLGLTILQVTLQRLLGEGFSLVTWSFGYGEEAIRVLLAASPVFILR